MLSDVLNLEILDMDSTYDLCTPALSEFQSTVCKLYCDTFVNDKINYESDDFMRPSVETSLCGTARSAKQGSCDALPADRTVFESGDCVKPSMETSLCESRNSVEQADSDRHEAGEHSIHWDMSDVDQSQTRNQKVENALLETLLSKSYEVRNTILEKLSEMMLCSKEQLKYANEDVGVGDGSVCVGDGKMECRMVSLFHSSHRLYARLLAMLDGESHEECQIKLLG